MCFSVDIRALLEEHQDSSLKSSIHGHMQWGPAVIVVYINIQTGFVLGTMLEQLLEYLQSPMQHSPVQCRAAIAIIHAYLSTVGE